MSIRKSLIISLLEKYSSLVINIISTVILARLLTPTEIGVFSIGAAFVAIAHSIRDFGITNYIIQEKEISRAKAKASLFVATLIAWPIGISLFIFSPFIADYYNDTSITNIFRVMASCFFFLPFSSISQAFLKRNLNFKTLYVINVSNTIVQSGTAIVLAYYNFGYMSLAWAVFASAIVNFLLCYAFKDKLVSYIPSYKNIASILHFGGISTIAGILSEIGTNAPEIILGKSLGFSSVGLYSRANGVATMFDKLVVGAVSNITTPVFANKIRSGEDLKQPYLFSISYLIVIAWPFLFFMILNTENIVLLMLGSQWTAAVPIVKILCLSYIVTALGQFGSLLLIASGKVTYVMKTGLLVEPGKIILILIAVTYGGLYEVAFGIVISSIIQLVTTYIFLFRIITFSILDLLKIIFYGSFVSSMSIGFAYLGKLWAYSLDCSNFISLPISPPNCTNILILAISGLSFLLFCGISISIIKHPIAKELGIAFDFIKKSFKT